MTQPDVLCFSHLRWDFVYQRPNHLMTRCARERRVFYIEEPVVEPCSDHLEIRQVERNLLRVVPHLAPTDPETQRATFSRLVATLGATDRDEWPIHWFYTPMMLPVAYDLPRSLVVYDCMDELANFLHAPAQLREYERRLLSIADVVFTGGNALYGSKRSQHPNVHLVPSSVDAPFFMRARKPLEVPADQRSIPRPRIGYCGVIDERIDLDLLDYIAEQRPEWQIVMVGPIAKVDPATLPRRSNIHYLGGKPYSELPSYLASWDAAILPFALNMATRFISPTKTPEYLAAGRGVVSTAIWDVIEPYERLGLVRIGRDGAEFIEELAEVLAGKRRASDAARDAFLATNSWDTSWRKMKAVIEAAQDREVVQASASGELAIQEGWPSRV